MDNESKLFACLWTSLIRNSFTSIAWFFWGRDTTSLFVDLEYWSHRVWHSAIEPDRSYRATHLDDRATCKANTLWWNVGGSNPSHLQRSLVSKAIDRRQQSLRTVTHCREVSCWLDDVRIQQDHTWQGDGPISNSSLQSSEVQWKWIWFSIDRSQSSVNQRHHLQIVNCICSRASCKGLDLHHQESLHS